MLFRSGHRVEYEWDEAFGRAGFERALATIDEAENHPSGRLSGMVAPAQIDTCSEALLRDAYAVAEDRNLPFQVHAGQSISEFHEMTRRHGMTPIEWMHHIGVLGRRTTVGHGIFLDHHPWTHWRETGDLRMLAEAGATVAHCPSGRPVWDQPTASAAQAPASRQAQTAPRSQMGSPPRVGSDSA